MEISPSIIEKVKKCLALSGSPNPHEAATAMRQAHALMAKYGVSHEAIVMADIGEATTDSKTLARDKPAQWELRLAGVVGKAFGCQIMTKRIVLKQGKGHLNQGGYIFVGLKQQAEIAAYTAAVLIRKCKSARQKWLAERFGGLGRGVKGGKAKMTRMGDMFAEGWVTQIGQLVADFANPEGIDEAIAQHVKNETNGSPAEARSVKDIKYTDQLAAAMGMQAPKGEALYRPCETAAAPARIGSVQA